MRTTFLAAALAALTLAGLGAQGGPAHAQGCASGFHTDPQGNCQPNVAETNRYCPPGAIFHPWINGWFCDSPGGRAFYN